MNRSYKQPDKPRGRLRRGAVIGFTAFLLLVAGVTVAFAISGLAHTQAVQAMEMAGISLVGSQVQVSNATPTPTVTSSSTATETLTVTSTATASPTQTETVIPTATQTPTVTVSPTATQTPTVSPTPTDSPTATPTASLTATATTTPTATWTAAPSPTASATAPPTVTPTLTPTTPAVFPSPTVIAVATPSAGTARPGPTIVLAVGAAVLLLAATVFGVALILLRRRRPARDTKAPPPTPGPPAIPPKNGQPVLPPEKRGLLTPVRPQPGISYLESRSRSAGVLYCPLDKPVVTIGRDLENDLILDASFEGWQTVSRRHATIENDGQRAIVVDQDSCNGVYINDRRTGTNVLRDGCTVRFGNVEFIFRKNQGGGVS